LVEIERAKLGFDLTKITLESFLEWKKKKIREKQDKDQKENDRKKAEFKAGKNVGLSGREMFTFNPDLAKDEDMEEGEMAFDNIPRDDDEEDDQLMYREINLEALVNEAQETDGSGTQTIKREFNLPPDKSETIAAGGLDQNVVVESEPIDETLFAEEDDLDILEDELNSLSVEK
jgi:hypothetical protein